MLQALRHSGRQIPEDTSVIGVGDTDLSQLFSPAITTLTWDLDAVGTAAAQLLLKRLDSEGEVDPDRILITTQLVLRESCGTVSKAPQSANLRR